MRDVLNILVGILLIGILPACGIYALICAYGARHHWSSSQYWQWVSIVGVGWSALTGVFVLRAPPIHVIVITATLAVVSTLWVRGLQALSKTPPRGLTESSVSKKYLPESRRMHDTGRSTEDILAWLREQGATKVESIRLLIELGGLANEEAKMIVHWSDAWQDTREADDGLQASVEEAARQLLKSLDQKRQ